MAIEPRRIGRFLGVDRLGNVEPDVAADRIGDVWKPVVELVRDALMTRQDVRAIYLRGSIPRGLAIENVSDADFIYFSESRFDAEDFELERQVEAKFPFLKGLELSRLDRATFDKVCAPQKRPYFHMLLKTQCLFLAGDDLARHIEPFQIGPEMVSHLFALAAEFALLPRWLDEARSSGTERSARQWFSRRVVRSGAEVTMDRSDRFTRDLYLCYEQFAQFYPERADQMLRALVNCLNGADCPLQYRELVSFLTAESARLVAVRSARRSRAG